MNIPEIAKCIFCDASGELLPDWGERDRKVKHPDDHRQPLERCPLTGMIVELHWWNRRQPTPEAAAAESRRCVWLLERRLWNKPESPVVYFRQREPYLFTVNPNEALQFATKEEAEAVRISYENEPGHRPHYYHYEVHEHIFLEAAHPPKPEPTEATADREYRGMEYPLDQLPGIWLKLCAELRERAKETEKDDPELAIRFRHRAISIYACAEQLKWSLAHQAPTPPAEWMALSKQLAKEIQLAYSRMAIKHQEMVELTQQELLAVIAPIMQKHYSAPAGTEAAAPK